MESGKANKKTVRQHFVPRSYLRRFKDGSGALWMYDKTNRRVVATGEDVVAGERSFYDYPADSLKDGGAEKWAEAEMGERIMQAFERELERVLKLLLSEGPHVGISLDLRYPAAFSMAIQYMRTPSFRRDLAEQNASFLQALTRDMVEDNFPGQGHLAPRILMPEAT